MELPLELAVDIHVPYVLDVHKLRFQLFGQELESPLRKVSGEIHHDDREPCVSIEIHEAGFIHSNRQFIHDVERSETKLVVKVLVIGVVDELDVDRGEVPVGAGLNVFDVFQTVQGLLDLRRHELFHVLGACAEVNGVDENLAHINRRHVFQGNGEETEDSRHHHDHEDHVDQHFLPDSKSRKTFHWEIPFVGDLFGGNPVRAVKVPCPVRVFRSLPR